MDERKEKILGLVIETHIETAEPVGSKFLSEHDGIPVSGATVRNELSELEKQGYLTHPHTSAGRTPTEKGYQYYVDHLAKPSNVSVSTERELTEIVSARFEKQREIKTIAKYVAEITQSAVIVEFKRDQLYYTGISNLFSQPEFRDRAYMVKISSIFDQCEERMQELHFLSEKTAVATFLGSSNPLGSACTSMVTSIGKSLFVLLGPMRMDYKRHLGLLEYLHTQI